MEPNHCINLRTRSPSPFSPSSPNPDSTPTTKAKSEHNRTALLSHSKAFNLMDRRIIKGIVAPVVNAFSPIVIFLVTGEAAKYHTQEGRKCG
jgi:hypothetical protein